MKNLHIYQTKANMIHFKWRFSIKTPHYVVKFLILTSSVCSYFFFWFASMQIFWKTSFTYESFKLWPN